MGLPPDLPSQLSQVMGNETVDHRNQQVGHIELAGLGTFAKAFQIDDTFELTVEPPHPDKGRTFDLESVVDKRFRLAENLPMAVSGHAVAREVAIPNQVKFLDCEIHLPAI